jgi:predicted 3-demethylubiquinone-9 3-methyltransferase (glyoxalase superfamily)
MQRITPFLWFDDNALEAAEFYCSVFEGEITNVAHQGPGGPVMMVNFRLEGQDFMALNGGPMFSFTPAISLFVSCRTQAEIDELWDKLSAGGGEQHCVWVKDRFGLSWQIIPARLGELMSDSDPARAQRVMQALRGMKKLEIAGLEAAANA